MPGHQARLSPLPPIQSPSPRQDHRLTLILNPFQRRRAHAQTLTAQAQAQRNGMTSVGGHERAASHANILVTVIAVAVQAADALIICARWRCQPHLSFLGFSVCYMCSSHTAPHSRGPFVGASLGGKAGLTCNKSIYAQYHEHTASDALVFIINATMSLMDSSFQ